MPDMRETIPWHPQVEIGPGERREFMEGFDMDGILNI